jgi:hypothetical protein
MGITDNRMGHKGSFSWDNAFVIQSDEGCGRCPPKPVVGEGIAGRTPEDNKRQVQEGLQTSVPCIAPSVFVGGLSAEWIGVKLPEEHWRYSLAITSSSMCLHH